jgi:hypothetical protein
MDVATIALTFPLQIAIGALYARLTNRVFTLRYSNIFDLCIFVCVVIWFNKFEYYTKKSSVGFMLMQPPHPYHKFLNNVFDDIVSGAFHFDWLMAGTLFCFWIRLMMMTQLTETFGPLIKIMISMVIDMGVFFAIWSVQLIAFACVGILIFGKLKQYSDLYTTLMMLFETSMGAWDLTIYDPYGESKWIG